MDETDWVAMLDQTLRGLQDLARVMRTYYEALIAAGFSPDQALGLTVAFQAGVQHDARNPAA